MAGPGAAVRQKETDAVKFFKGVCGFTEDAAKSLHNEQAMEDETSFLDLNDDLIDDICNHIRKPGGTGSGHPVALVAVTRFKLGVFFVKHHSRISRKWPKIKDIDRTALDSIKDQKILEDDYDSSKDIPIKELHLDESSAPACFEKIKTILASIRGASGVPLAYVVRARLVPEDQYADPGWGEEDSDYTTIDDELIARAPILDEDVIYPDDDEHEEDGTFHPKFIVDMRRVWTILLTAFGASQPWKLVKKHGRNQNGRKAWRTLHDHFFGGDKCLGLYQAALTRLNNYRYEQDRKNFTFTKYLTNHVNEHHILDTLHSDYKQQAVPEVLKIKYFQDGIKDPTFDPVRLSIEAQPSNFMTFDKIKDYYLNFKRMQEARAGPGTTRTISEFRRDGPGRGGRGKDDRGGGRGTGRGGRGHDHDKDRDSRRRAGLPSQAEVDKCTHIVDRKYTDPEYKRLTPAEQQRLYQIRKGKAQGAGGYRGRDSTSTLSETGSKRKHDDSSYDYYGPQSGRDCDGITNDDKDSANNRTNCALKRNSPSGRQVYGKSEE